MKMFQHQALYLLKHRNEKEALIKSPSPTRTNPLWQEPRIIVLKVPQLGHGPLASISLNTFHAFFTSPLRNRRRSSIDKADKLGGFGGHAGDEEGAEDEVEGVVVGREGAAALGPPQELAGGGGGVGSGAAEEGGEEFLGEGAEGGRGGREQERGGGRGAEGGGGEVGDGAGEECGGGGAGKGAEEERERAGEEGEGEGFEGAEAWRGGFDEGGDGEEGFAAEGGGEVRSGEGSGREELVDGVEGDVGGDGEGDDEGFRVRVRVVGEVGGAAAWRGGEHRRRESAWELRETPCCFVSRDAIMLCAYAVSLT
ncbi:hypothetical protein ACMD2_05684 [Ananas comosus]|uniref:Uncharacterized protein n=1 Tax=Ananas comosus TaxID=4615 RepID=A0A199W784_ANACO|nr:hypothetical protein ACMD2_05684 [Ananas comosus]